MTNFSYEQVEIEPNSVIYCDPPYKDISSYKSKFDHSKFYSWARQQKNIYISEYQMPEDFLVLHTIGKVSSMSSSNDTKTVETVFVTPNTPNPLEW